MAMRLLKKSEVTQRQQAQQKQNVDEGVKLAKRIDRLRETAAYEERSLNDFRRQQVSEIQKEISVYVERRNTLQKEVAEYERRREKALEPVADAWREVEQAQKEAKNAVLSGERYYSEAKEAERTARLHEKDTQNARRRIETQEDVKKEELRHAEDAKEKAVQLRKDAEELHAKTNEWAEALSADIIHREAECAARERGVTMREATNKRREQELAKEWKLLEDRKQMFERTKKST